MNEFFNSFSTFLWNLSKIGEFSKKLQPKYGTPLQWYQSRENNACLPSLTISYASIVQHDRFVEVCDGVRWDMDSRSHGTCGHCQRHSDDRYVIEIIHPVARPFAGAVGQDLILIIDNARPQTAGVTKQYLLDAMIELNYGIICKVAWFSSYRTCVVHIFNANCKTVFRRPYNSWLMCYTRNGGYSSIHD